MAANFLSLFVMIPILALGTKMALGDSYLKATEDEIRVGSFNVQVFGLTKLGKNEVVEILCKVSKAVEMLRFAATTKGCSCLD